MDKLVEYAKRVVRDSFIKDKKNMPILYETFSKDEKEFIEVFNLKTNNNENIIYNMKNNYINFCYKDMQIGRIRLNNKINRMQVLTIDEVIWIENISKEEAIINIDKWIKYLEYLIEKESN